MPVECEVVAPGEVLRARQEKLSSVLHLVSGRVQLGILEDGQMRHQLGVVEGPFWLDGAAAMLGMPCAVDMVTQAVLHDVARAHRQQTELAVSRLAQDAEARCAQWLLRHAQHDSNGALSVTLSQRKRLIAAQLGIAPETFSRVLRSLREHGLILGTGNVLKLPQPGALEMVASGS